MLVVGDVFVRRENPQSVFRHVRPLFKQADFLLGNLEGAVADSGEPRNKRGARTWKADARQIAAIEYAGFDAMTVANNHMLDFGLEAMFETLAHLDRIGVVHTGAGCNFAEAHRPAIVEKHGCRVALLGFTSVFMEGWAAGEDSPGLAVMRAGTAYQPPPRFLEVPGMPPTIRSWIVSEDKEQLARDISQAGELADLVVCSFHWGISLGHRHLAEYQIELGRHAIECGADLVFGHHPHLVQAIEAFQRKAIFYSLGNFTFADHNPAKGQELETIVVSCAIRDGRIVSVDYLPARCDENLDPSVLDTETGRDVVELVLRRSAQFGTRFEVNERSVRVVLDGSG